jgi:hypothetical protein
MPNPQPITFLVPGQPSTSGATRARGAAATDPTLNLLGGDVTQSVIVSTQRAAGGQDVPVTAVPGRDVVVMHVDRGPMLVLHPENARALMLAQGHAMRGSAAAEGAVRVPARLPTSPPRRARPSSRSRARMAPGSTTPWSPGPGASA